MSTQSEALSAYVTTLPEAIGVIDRLESQNIALKKTVFELTATKTVLDAEIAKLREQEPVAWKGIEAIANARYKVVQAHSSMFYRYAVVAGDGNSQVYLGREAECESMARKFTGAFLDGAFVALYTHQAPAPAQWQELSEEETTELLALHEGTVRDLLADHSAALREKNMKGGAA